MLRDLLLEWFEIFIEKVCTFISVFLLLGFGLLIVGNILLYPYYIWRLLTN
jgi:hypothetical protein